jgi:hypothetical protein
MSHRPSRTPTVPQPQRVAARSVPPEKMTEGGSVPTHEQAADPHPLYLLHSEFVATEGVLRKTGDGTYTVHKTNLAAEAAPTVTDDASAGYSVGSIWVYGTSVYVCTNAAVGAANWEDLTSAGASDGDAIHDNVSGEISAITEKATPIGADLVVIEDSAASNAKKRVQLGNLPSGAHGIAAHTAHGTHKLLYTDGSGDEQELALGTDGQKLAATGASSAPAFEDDVEVIYARLDPTSASTTTAKISVGPLPFAGTFVKATLKTVPGETCGATTQIVDIHLQTAANENTDTDSTVFSTQANRPQITNTNKSGNTSTFNTTTFAKGDWLYIYSDQAGTGLTGLEIGIEVKRT